MNDDSKDLNSSDIDKMLSDLYGSEGGDELAKISATEVGNVEIPQTEHVTSAPQSPGEERAARATTQYLNTHISVKLNKDSTEAQIVISTPKPGDPDITPEDIVERLKSAGVVFGIDHEMVNRIGRPPYPSSPLVVAKGKKPQNGEDAEFEYIFLDQQKIGPKQRQDGSVDYRDLGLVTNVKTGDILVEKTAATPGTPGMSVKGIKINPRPGRDKKFKKGRGVQESEDGLKLVAAVDGSPHMADGKVSVEPIYTVQGNVDYAVGNIDFVGNVKIFGSVESGFIVKARGDVEILGLVENSTIEAGGNITIRGRAFGRSKGLISADGDINMKLVDQYNIRAGGSVNVEEGIMHSDVTAEKAVIIRQPRGRMVGGTIKAGELVESAIIGDPNYGTRTTIEVGMSPEIRRELHQLKEDIIESRGNQQRVLAALHSLRFMQKKLGKLPPDKEKTMNDLEKVKIALEGSLASMEEREEELERSMTISRPAYVKAHKVICPGVKVTINDRVRLITSEVEYCTLREEEGEIKIGPYA